MNKELEAFIPLCDSIGKLFYPNVEVVLHDLKKEKLLYITNSFSKRKIGDKLINDIKDFDTITKDIIGPYTKKNTDGQKLKTISTIIRDVNKKPIGMVCINFKIEVFTKAYESLKILLNIEEIEEKPSTLFSQDWKEHTQNLITSYLEKNTLAIETLKIKDKKELIIYLNTEGVFSIRNVVTYLCEILSISRATIYKWLKENKS